MQENRILRAVFVDIGVHLEVIRPRLPLGFTVLQDIGMA
jgi:hypothetical protein